MWLYHNLFQPVLHLVSKVAVGEGHIKRKWDETRSPYQRLPESGVLDDLQKRRLEKLYEAANPRVLRAEIHRTVETLWDEPVLDRGEKRGMAELTAA